MMRERATVEDGFLYLPTGAARIRLDTPAWTAWLEAPTTTRFSYALFNPAQGYIEGWMTVQKERRQRGTNYWVAYRRQAGQLRKIYVGRTTALTQARLRVVAGRIAIGCR